MIKRIAKFTNSFSKGTSRFRKEESGSTAVEFALISPLLAGLFLAALDLGSTGFTQDRLSSSLRFSAQYIANGGTDLDVAEDVFQRSFGSYDSFTSEVSCTCARSRYTLDTDPESNQNQTASTSAADEVLGNISGTLLNAPQCTTSCGEAPVIRYLELSAKAMSRPILGSEYTEVRNSVSVRLQ